MCIETASPHPFAAPQLRGSLRNHQDEAKEDRQQARRASRRNVRAVKFRRPESS